MFSGVPRHSGTRVTGAVSTASTISSRRIVGVDRHHLGAVDHDVGHRQLAQIEQAAHHVAVELLDDALAVQEIDGAAQLLVRREDRLDLADRHAEQPQDDRAPATRPRQDRREQRTVASSHRPRDHRAPCGRAR